MGLRSVSSLGVNVSYPAAITVRQQEQSLCGNSFAHRPSLNDRSLLGDMSILSSRSLLVGEFKAPDEDSCTDSSSSSEELTASNPRSHCAKSEDVDTFLYELPSNGRERDINHADRQQERISPPCREVEAVAFGRCLPLGRMFSFFTRWGRKIKRKSRRSGRDTCSHIPDEICVRPRNANDQSTRSPCRLATSKGPYDDRNAWVGTIANSGRILKCSQELFDDKRFEANVDASVSSSNDGLVLRCDDVSVASSVTLTVNLKNEERNDVRCAGTPSDRVELPVSLVLRREASINKSASIFNGYYA